MPTAPPNIAKRSAAPLFGINQGHEEVQGGGGGDLKSHIPGPANHQKPNGSTGEQAA